MEFHVGNTPVRDVEVGGRMCRVKDESANEASHTHKDRRSVSIVDRALADRIDTLAIITSGNGGLSLARIAKDTGLRIVALIDAHTPDATKQALSAAGAELCEIDVWGDAPLSRRKVGTLVRRRARERVRHVTQGYADAYSSIVTEVLPLRPRTIVVPVGTGELIEGVHRGIKKHGLETKLIGVLPLDDWTSKADKLTGSWSPVPHVTHQVQNGSYALKYFSEEELQWCMHHAPSDLAAEPSALAVFATLLWNRDDIQDALFINTGRGV